MSYINLQGLLNATSLMVEYFAVKNCSDEEAFYRTVMDTADTALVSAHIDGYIASLSAAGVPFAPVRDGYSLLPPDHMDADSQEFELLQRLAETTIATELYGWWLSLCGYESDPDVLPRLEQRLVDGYAHLLAESLAGVTPRVARRRGYAKQGLA